MQKTATFSQKVIRDKAVKSGNQELLLKKFNVKVNWMIVNTQNIEHILKYQASDSIK